MPFNKGMCPEADRTMRDAFEALERIITIPDRMQLENLALDDVERAALQVEKHLAASQSLRNMRRLAPLFRGLEHYSHTIEILCNGTPYLPWVWAPIKLILEISSDYIKAFESIIQIYHRLAEPLARFSIFDHSFSNNTEVQKALAIYYSDILKFHGEAYKFIRRNAWQRLFATSWGRFQRRFDTIFADLKAHEDLIDKTANAANISEARKMRERLESWRHQEAIKLKREEEEQTSIEFQAVVNFLRVDETHQIKIFDNFAAEADQNPGSGHWILKQPKIRSWAKCSRDTQFLVLHGSVGSGKSILATQIGTFLRSSKYLLVTHYCTYVYPESTDYNHIILSLMIQIMRLDPELITLSYNWFLVEKKKPNRSVLEQLLRLLVETLGSSTSEPKTLHIVIDGLNECDDNTIANVVKMLEKLIATPSSVSTIKVLLCTQMSLAVAKAAKKKHQVSLSDEKDNINEAIRGYALQIISGMQPQRSQFRITDNDVMALTSQITQKADGMFLWAKLIIAYMKSNLFYNRDEFLEAASGFPRELSKVYDQLLSQILAGLDERSFQRIGAILSWIAFAKRPLRSPELLSALAFDSGDEVTEPVPAYVLDQCQPLIQEQTDSSYSLLHVSVRDFLQSSVLSITASESLKRHDLAAARCLLASQRVFAPSYSEADRVLKILRGIHGFHMYATEVWIDCFLEYLKLDQDLLFESDFFIVSSHLAEQFEGIESNKLVTANIPSDTRFASLRQKHYPLYKTVQALLLERGKTTLEENEFDSDTIDNNNMTGDITALKKRYQMTIRGLLNRSSYPGVSFQELERFKQNFRTSAFTCRIWSCTRAVFGFSSLEHLNLHEADHRKQICRFPGCQYPVFSSAKMLKDHENKIHVQRSQTVPRKSIKKQVQPNVSASTSSLPKLPSEQQNLEEILHDRFEELNGIDLMNPIRSGDVLDDFDFDKFLNDGDGDDEAFDFDGYPGLPD